MKITIESTSKIVQVNGVPCRIWEGETERGIKMHAFITRVAVHNSLDASQFDAELAEQKAPSAEVSGVYPLRMVL